jgi:uncharacterized protein (DUF1499 family)
MNETTTPKLPRRVGYATVFLLIITVLALLIAGPSFRFEVLGVMSAFMVLMVAAIGGVLCLVIGLISTILNLRKGTQGLVAISVLATLVGLGLTLNNLNWFNKGKGVPSIHDISTDTVNPPEFVAVAPLRADAPNPVEYAGNETAEKQLAAFPDLVTTRLDANPAQVFAASVATAVELGWEMVAEVPTEGRVEATDTTTYFGFKDDVVIRIAPDGAGSVIDVRSKSRVGVGDVGANADRIRAFLTVLQARL